MITEEKFAQYLKLERLGFEKCNDYEYYGQVYKKLLNDAIVYVDITTLNGRFNGICAFICFEKIESLINYFVKKFHIKTNRGVYQPLSINPYFLTPNIESAMEKNRKAREIYLNLDNVQQVADLVYEYLTAVYQPFWEKYSSLQVVNDEIIDKIDQMKLTDCIPFDMAWKKLIIMKLCNNQNYDSYVNWLESIWQKKALTENLTQNNQYQMYLELREILETERIKEYL